MNASKLLTSQAQRIAITESANYVYYVNTVVISDYHSDKEKACFLVMYISYDQSIKHYQSLPDIKLHCTPQIYRLSYLFNEFSTTFPGIPKTDPAGDFAFALEESVMVFFQSSDMDEALVHTLSKSYSHSQASYIHFLTFLWLKHLYLQHQSFSLYMHCTIVTILIHSWISQRLNPFFCTFLLASINRMIFPPWITFEISFSLNYCIHWNVRSNWQNLLILSLCFAMNATGCSLLYFIGQQRQIVLRL